MTVISNGIVLYYSPEMRQESHFKGEQQMDLQVIFLWESRHFHSQGWNNHSYYLHLSYHGKKNLPCQHNSNRIHRRGYRYHRP